MEESFKNRVIIILSVLCLILLIGTINSCSSAYRQKNARDKEMAARLDFEEKASKVSREKVAIEEKLKGTVEELEKEKTTLEANQKLLLQEQLVSQSLKEELQKEVKLREVIEEDLKNALAKSNKSKR